MPELHSNVYIRTQNIVMVLLAHFIGALYGLLAVIFGAFGAHALKKTFSEDQLKSFETGVKYQMYHALVLLVIGFNFNLTTPLEEYMVYSFILGTFLFSFSIYGLTLSASKGKKLSFLGPITPLGGLFLVIGWSLLLWSFIKGIV
jgi:uncharacterized membrane protein YgdD (TMEM256/DUF423 family)